MKTVLLQYLALISCCCILSVSADECIGSCYFEKDFELEWSTIENHCRTIYESQGWSKESWDYEPEEEENGDLDWDELPAYRKEFLESIGWTEDAWDNDDCSKVNPYALDWKEMKPKQKKALTVLGWNEEQWKQYKETGILPETNDRSDSKPWNELTSAEIKAVMDLGYDNTTWHKPNSNNEFNPKVVELPIKELENIDFEFLSKLGLEVEVRDGSIIGDDEYLETKKMKIHEYITELKNGSNFYLKYEDGDEFQTKLHSLIGDTVINSFVNELEKNGMFKLEWKNLNLGVENWTIFVGGKGTSTSIHFDFDEFNFLWVSQGRKRMVLIPNTDQSKEEFQCEVYYEGHSCWPKVDVLHGGKIKDSVEIEIGPHCGIVVPYLSWHAVENIEPTIAFGFRIGEWI